MIAESLGNTSPITLDFPRFTAAPTPPTPGILTTLAFYDVPIGQSLALRGDVPFILKIKGRVIRTFAASGSLTSTVILTGLRAAKSPLGGLVTYPTVYHPDFVCLISDDGVNFTPSTINSVNYVTGVIGYTKTATTTAVKLYYLMGDGEIQLTAFAPSGYDQERRGLFVSSAVALHTTDQVSSDFKLNRFQTQRNFAPQMRLDIRVRSNADVVWLEEAQHEIVIHGGLQPVRVYDRAAFEKLALDSLKGI